MLLAIKAFGGIMPRLDPRRLPNHGALVAVNCDLKSATLAPLKQTSFVWTPTKAGTKQTIYRFGETVNDESLYWFTWADDVDVVRGQIASDTTERTFFTGDSAFGHPRWTDATLALTGGGTNYPIASYRLGVPAPASAPTNGGISGTGSGTNETRAYVYVYVTAGGDVGQPSLPLEVTIQDGQSITLTGLLAAPAGYNITRKWIYRTLTGAASGTDYQFVAEVVDGTTSYVDSTLNKNLGETLNSVDYEMPPATLKGLVNLPNGMAAGFDGINVYLCEPYKLYAWPSKYKQVVDYPVVGLGVFGESLVVLTRGQPYLMFGTDPNAVSVKKIELMQACIAKRSIVEMGDAVMYASPDGLVRVGPGMTDVVTRNFIDKDFWTSLNPASIHAYQYEGRYVGFYDNGTPGSFIFDPTDELAPFALTTLTATAGYTDVVRDGLFLAVGTEIRQFDDNAATLSYTWTSHRMEIGSARNFGWAKVEANAFPVTLKVYARDVDPASGTHNQMVLRHTEVATSQRPFRLPSGFVSDEWEVRLEGAKEVTGVFLAQSPEELRQS
jgi:hypothetical protein